MKSFLPFLRALFAFSCLGTAAAHAGTVSGNVTDSLDQPLAGVQVCALQKSLLTQQNGVFALVVEPPRETFVVVDCRESAGDGSYSLALPATTSSYLVQIDEAHIQSSGLNVIPEYHTGDVTTRVPPSLVALLQVGGQDTASVDFKLDRGYRFSGRITARDSGQAIPGALVCPLKRGDPWPIPYRCFPANASGEYSTLPLPPGSWILSTYNQAGYVDVLHNGQVYYDWQEPTDYSWLQFAAADVSGVNFLLARGYTISGVVRDFAGLPDSTAIVCLHTWFEVGHRSLGCSSTLNGYYETPPLLRGTYLLYVLGTASGVGTFHNGVLYDSNAINQIPPLVLQERLTDFDLAAGKPVHFSGTVTRGAGDPVPGATVCFHRRRGLQDSYDLHDCVLANAQGQYRSDAMVAGYYGVTAGIGVVQQVMHDGLRVPLTGVSTVANPILATADITADLDFALSAAERLTYLAGNIADFSEPYQNWQSPEKPPARLALILEEAVLLADEFSAGLPSDAALAAAETVGKAFEAGVEWSRYHLNPDWAGIDAALSALARLVRTLDIANADTGLTDDSRRARLRALTLTVLKSAKKLREVQTSVEDIESTSATLAAFLNGVLSQGIEFDAEYITPFSELASASMSWPVALDVLTARGIFSWTDASAIAANLRANPAALEDYLRVTALPLDFPAQERRSLAAGLLAPDVDLALGDYFDATADSLDPIWAILNSEDPQQPLNVLREALARAGMSNLVPQDANGQVNLVTGQGVIPAVAARVLLVSYLAPNGVVTLPDGSALAIHERVAVQVAPAPVNAASLGTLLGTLGEFALGNDGSVRVRQNGGTISATLNFQKVASTTGAEGPAQIEWPVNLASIAPADVFRIRYANGATQTFAPFVSAPGFFTSLSERGFSYQVNRATGVIVVNGRSYRPSFIVNAPDAADLAFHAQAARQQGIAYRAGDFNGDGKTDYKVITAASAQVVYGL